MPGIKAKRHNAVGSRIGQAHSTGMKVCRIALAYASWLGEANEGNGAWGNVHGEHAAWRFCYNRRIMEKKRASWSGQLAFVLAAAASAIGLGNLWRFPYLAAQYGGGIFIVIYLALVVTLGFTLMTTEIAIGRLTRQSQLTAYSQLHRGWGFIGLLGTVVPVLIVPYYCVIGGWVLKYLVAYAKMAVTGAALMGEGAADSGAFFSSFISAPFAPFGYGILFILACAGVIVLGVKNGIEKSNLVMMPILFVMAIAIAIYVACLPGSLDGLKYYLIPNMSSLCATVPVLDGNGVPVLDGAGNAVVASKFSFALLCKTVLGAMGQMFYSLSLAMGIMITYGSYMRGEDPIEKSVRRIEIFDTLIAVVAGLMIIPVVYMFATKTGTPVREAMNAGPGLMFITLPKVFAMLGRAGTWLGLAFFVLVTFAAATSAISLYEACVASVCDLLGMKRRNATFFMFFVIAFFATFSALGYGPWSKVTLSALFTKLGFTGAWTRDAIYCMQGLDFFDFVTNSILMPVVALATCIFVGWIIGPGAVVDEIRRGGHAFKARGFFVFMTKWIAPLLIVAILVSEICRNLGIGGWKI